MARAWSSPDGRFSSACHNFRSQRRNPKCPKIQFLNCGLTHSTPRGHCIGHPLWGRICNLHIALKFSAFAWKWQSHSMTAAADTTASVIALLCFASLLIQFNPLAGPKTASGESHPSPSLPLVRSRPHTHKSQSQVTIPFTR